MDNLADDDYADISQFLDVSIAEGETQIFENQNETVDSEEESVTLQEGESSTFAVSQNSNKQTFAALFQRFGPSNGKKCPYCHQYFAKGKFSSHLMTHTQEKPHSCSVCNKSFRRSDRLKNHIRLHQKKKKPIKRGFIYENFNIMNDNILLKKRLPAAGSEGSGSKKQAECPYCLSTFAGNYKLLRHIRTHTGFKPYQCCCGAKFTRTEHWKKHRQVKNCESYVKLLESDFKLPDGTEIPKSVNISMPQSSSSPESKSVEGYKCEFCGKIFSKSFKLNLHRRTHTGEKPFECETCTKRFARKDHLLKHLKVHLKYRTLSAFPPSLEDQIAVGRKYSGTSVNEMNDAERDIKQEDIKNLKCPACGLTSTSIHNFKLHLASHDGSGVYSCGTCLLTFNDKETYDLHILLHNVDESKCDLCSLVFDEKESYESHLATHESDVLRCDPCCCIFNSKETQEIHLLQHKSEESPIPQPTRHQCTYCYQWLPSEEALNTHIGTHAAGRPNQCDLCPKIFVRRSDMIRHRRTHTGENMFQCLLCECSYTRKDKLLKHIRNKHL